MVEVGEIYSLLGGSVGFDWVLGLWMLGVAVSAALTGLLTVWLWHQRTAGRLRSVFHDADAETVFLFDGETLVDATPQARALLTAVPVDGGALQQLMAFLVPRFPSVEARLAALPSEGAFTLAGKAPGVGTAGGSDLRLRCEWRGGLTRVSVSGTGDHHRAPILDPMTHRAIDDELSLLREIVAHVPVLIWRENEAAEIVWANNAYVALAARRLHEDQDMPWPLPRLLPSPPASGLRVQVIPVEGAPGGAEEQGWHEAVTVDHPGGRTVFALPSDRLVRTEVSLRNFRQTLTKTFAHLPIGLAIFDRDRQLALFNPALLDLTALPADFLSSRPTLFAFLDAMRDRNMIPEPKDYRSWRRQMADLEKAAASGRYEETWILPSGQTYRVIGRPHPDGAMALLFEDISTEMSRTRRYRADLELGQSVIDAMEEWVAVFSASGSLLLANTAYSRLWNHEPEITVDEIGIGAMVAHWRSGSAPSELWTQAEDFVSALGERREWSGEARLNDGRLVRCRFTPLPGSSTLISFRLASLTGAPEVDRETFRTRRRA
jgi:PAS domain-containing protein